LVFLRINRRLLNLIIVQISINTRRLLILNLVWRRVLMFLITIIRSVLTVLNKTLVLITILVLKPRSILIILLILMESLVRLDYFINVFLNSIFHFLIHWFDRFIEYWNDIQWIINILFLFKLLDIGDESIHTLFTIIIWIS